MRAPWQSVADRLYGPPPPKVLARSARDSWRWARANHVIEVGVAILVLAAGLLLFGDVRGVGAGAAAAYTVLALYGLWIVVVQTGRPSLGHAALMGIGAYLTALLRLRAGLDGITSAVLAGVACAGIGWILGHGTSRLRPAFLALATWAFGWLVSLAAAAFPAQTGGVAGISFRAPTEVRVDALGLDVRFNDAGHLLGAVGVLLLAMLLLRSAQRSRIGLSWAAVRQQPQLAAAVGFDVAATRRWALAWGAALAGVAGSLMAQASGVVDPAAYSPLVSLQLFAAVLIGLPAGFLGPLLGYGVTVLLPDLLLASAGVPSDSRIQGVVVALLTIVALTVSLNWRRQARVDGSAPAAAGGNIESGVETQRPATPSEVSAAPALEVRGLSRAFGGLRALDGLSLSVAAGEIHGVIGPNGSGKSTLLRCIAGTIAADGGEVLVDGRSVLGMSAPLRVGAGIARTFQRPVVFGELSPLSQVEAALAWNPAPPGWLATLLRTPAVRDADERRRGAAAAHLAGLGLAAIDGPVDRLTTGEVRRLQVALALATNPSVLLLDEPVGGMDSSERSDFAGRLREVSRRGVAVVLVEHDLGFVTEVADRITAVAGGVLLATGTPAEVVRHPAVGRAYLGG